MTEDEKKPPASLDSPAQDDSLAQDDAAPSPPDLSALTQQGMQQLWTTFNTFMNSMGSAAQAEAEGGTAVGNAFFNYAGRNVANAVAFAQQLTQIKDAQDIVKAQTDFVRAQMEALAVQVGAMGEHAQKTSAERMEQVTALAEQVLGDRAKAQRWLRRRRQALNGETAMTMLATDAGAQMIEDMLLRMRSGLST